MIRTERLEYTVGEFRLVDFNLDVPRGEYFVLLGPAGAGKTMLLECLSGLNRVAAGSIHIDGRDVTRLEPRERGIGYVPQDCALFPHLSVEANIGFGLGPRWFRSRTAQRRTREVAEFLNVTQLLGRRPGGLSGGERQRVALARALATEPGVFLLDEPVSSLDEKTRDQVCRELKDLQRYASTTVLHVCHNFTEMLAVADRAAVLREGRLVQVGAPREILEKPRDRFVAEFVQARNILRARARPDGGTTWLEVAGAARIRTTTRAEGEAEFVIRPERIRLEPPSGGLPSVERRTPNRLTGTVSRVRDQAMLVQVSVDCGGGLELTACPGRREYEALQVEPGEKTALSFDPADVHVLEKEAP